MSNEVVIGVDIGATNIAVGKVEGNKIINTTKHGISSDASEKVIIDEIIHAIENVFDDKVSGIGIGVPSLVDIDKGIVYNVQNIPSWKRVFLKDLIEEHFDKKVFVNNDANCFAIGEKYFGKGKAFRNMVGITLGSGLGAGIIINDHLYSGKNCGAGEFGSLSYRDNIFESYCSGQFFKNEYGVKGHKVFKMAKDGDKESLKIFKKFGENIGDAVKSILFSLDPEAIIFGGSVAEAFVYFKEAMWNKVRTFPYKHAIDKLYIDKSDQPNIAVLGAAALYYDKNGSSNIRK